MFEAVVSVVLFALVVNELYKRYKANRTESKGSGGRAPRPGEGIPKERK
jgi:hypothetical protein